MENDKRMPTSLYQDWAITKNNPDYSQAIERLKGKPMADVLHAAIGISGEAGELMDAVKKVFLYGKSLDTDNVKEELGDLAWYMSLMMTAIGTTWEEVMRMNFEKLEKRYPSGFTEKAAQERLDKQGESK